MAIESTELATIEAAPATLFATDDPAAIIAKASVIADALADVLKRKRLTVRISGREYVRVEGWTLLGTMLGVFPLVEWSRPLDSFPPGFEARALAKTLDGRTVGAGEAQCSRSESTWRDRDDYAIRSMAQTRAIAKALRLPLGFVVSLAGYESTPAEEIEGEPDREPRSVVEDRQSRRQVLSPAQVALREEIEAARTVRGITSAELGEIARSAGVDRNRTTTLAQLRKILAEIETRPLVEETTNDDGHESSATEDGSGYGGS